MSKIKVELIREGVGELLKSDDVAAVCKQYAEAVASRAGDGYTVDTFVGKTRVNAMVSAETKEAYNENLKNNTLLKALGG